MTLDPKIVESMLQRTEDNFLDFKRKQYRFDTNWQISGFVRDLLTMANTPRTDSAYIVIGIGESNGRPTEVVGTQEHIDPAEVDRKLQDKVNAVPSIEYHVVEYKGCELGIYEIKVDFSGPFVPTKTFERLTPGSIYYRRNSQNVIATTPEDIERIVEWFNVGKPSDEPHFVDASSWQQFYRSCDGFDDRRAYICVIDEDTDTTEDGWRSFSALKWDLVIDFDVLTSESGAYAKCSESLGKLRSLKLTPLDGERPIIGPGASLWVAARGIRSRPTTLQEGIWREWHREKLTHLRNAMEAVARVSDIKPTTVIVFGGDPDFVRSVCEQIDDNFRDRVRFVFASQRNRRYSGIIETFEGDDVPISFGEACHHIRDLRHTEAERPDVEIPKMEGGVVPIQPEMARWLEEEFDLIHLPTNLTPDEIQSEIKLFHQGSQVSWYGLNAGIDIRRDGLDEVERRVREGLASRSVRRLDLSHWPGGGGSTIGHRLAWNIHTEFPAVLAHNVNPESNFDRIRYLFDISNLPVLVIIDSPSATTNDLDRLFDLVRGSNVWATILRVVRHYGDTQRHRPAPFLDAMLSTQEALALEERLSTLVPDRRSALHTLSRVEDRRRRTPFNYGITAYGRNFQGIETYVSNRLDRCNPQGKLVCLISSLVYHYGQQSIPLQLLAKRFGIPQSKVISLSDVVDEFVEDLFVNASGRVRPIHDLIAEEILRQLLGRDPADENWKAGIAEAAITLAEICAEQVATSGVQTSDMLHTVVLERHTEEFDADFSRLLKDVPSPEAQERVLTTLTDLFPYQPHFWAHLGRFRSLVTRNHQIAHACHRTAMELSPSDPTLHHMAGMSLRAQLYDLLGEVDRNNDAEANLRGLVAKAAERFERVRHLDGRNEYGYIAHVQMLERVINDAAIRKGFRYQTHEFLIKPNNGWYLRMLDQAEDLLVELTVARGGDSPSQRESTLRGALNRIYGNFDSAINGWTNLLDRSDTYCPPVRRNIVYAYLARKKGNWSFLSQRELETISDLTERNLSEEPESDANLRLWFRAARFTGRTSVDRAAETLSLRKLRSPTIDTLYYLYILKFLQSDEGALSMANEARELMAQCRATSVASAFPRTRIFEWLGTQSGLKALVNISELGGWDNEKKFWVNEHLLRRVRGTVSRIQSRAAGQIELTNGLTAFFVPSMAMVEGGFVRGSHEGQQVEFYLGFSYEELRAWSVSEFK